MSTIQTWIRRGASPASARREAWRPEPSLPRRIAGILGGFAYLLAALTLDARTTIFLAGSIALLIFLVRLALGGRLGGTAAGERWGEVAFAAACAASLAVGWGVLGDRWLAFLPIAFVAWGDGAAGLVRVWRPDARTNGGLPSIAMLLVCLGAATLYPSTWVGAAGAFVATAAERFRPTTHPLWDDNWTIVAASFATIAGLAAVAR